jgi:hypothetical protein
VKPDPALCDCAAAPEPHNHYVMRAGGLPGGGRA